MTENLGKLIGIEKSESFPLWIRLVISLPILKKKYAAKAISEIKVFEKGIELSKYNQASSTYFFLYRDIRRIWLEIFNSGSEKEGNLSFRIDIIAENLDVIYTLKKFDCSPNDPTLILMKQLYELWKKEVWKHYNVVAAIISMPAKIAGRTDIIDPDTLVYLCMQKSQTRYSYTSYHWEFPGGKIEQGESEVEALVREIKEEMNYEIDVKEHLKTINHTYKDFSITLSCWLCSAKTTVFDQKEHADHRWLTAAEMYSLEWCEADFPIVELLNHGIDKK